MSRSKTDPVYLHGPNNAEHEIRKAYNCVIDASVDLFWDKRKIDGVNPQELVDIYHHAFNCHRQGNRLAAERWARTAKHLARAFHHEAKIAYLEPRTNLIPYLEGAQDDEYSLYYRSDTTSDLLNSLENHIPPGLKVMPPEMTRLLSRARLHLSFLERADHKHELVRAERIKAAHEYGRVIECMALGYEAESKETPAAA